MQWKSLFIRGITGLQKGSSNDLQEYNGSSPQFQRYSCNMCRSRKEITILHKAGKTPNKQCWTSNCPQHGRLIIIIIRQFAMENYDQTNFQDDSHLKIKTPASLFSKSSGKSPINRLRTQPAASPAQQSFLDNHCENHHNKPATYYTQTDGERLHFCEKCAITLASHGHSITKIQGGTNLFTSPKQSTPSNSRRQVQVQPQPQSRAREAEIQRFLGELKYMRGAICSTRQTIKDKLIESEQFYGQQLQEINDYFSLIIKSLELEKHKCYNHILTERHQAEQHIRSLGTELSEIDQGVTKILMDIQDNLETVYSIEEDMYKLVFSQYVAQQQDFQGCLNGLLLEPIQLRRIEFQGVPESIYNISDVVIQNSINSQENLQYRLADSLIAEDFNHIRVVSPQKQSHANPSFSGPSSLKFSFQAERLRNQAQGQGWSQCNFGY